MRTRLRPIVRDYSYARSRRYLRVQCEPLGLKFIARYYVDDFPSLATARAAARQLCDTIEPVLRTAYAIHRRDPRNYFGKKSTPKSSGLPTGLSYEPASFPHRYVVVRWQALGKSQLVRFRLHHGQIPAILKSARQLRHDKVREEKLRVTELQIKVARRLRRAFVAARATGAHTVMPR